MNYIDPAFQHPDRPTTGTTIKRRKPVNQMTTQELREAAEAEGLKYYQAQLAADPYNEEKKYELEKYAEARGIRLDPEVNRLRDIPLDQLREEFETKGAAKAEQDLDNWRESQANIWMVSQPAFKPSPENADKLIAKINQLGLRGTPHDLELAFQTLVERGEIEPVPLPPEPIQLSHSREELQTMPLEQLKRLAEDAAR